MSDGQSVIISLIYLLFVHGFRYGYVCASKTMALRKLLEAETTDAGFTNEEKGRRKHKGNEKHSLVLVARQTRFFMFVCLGLF